MNMTGVRPDAFACSTCWPSCSVSVVMQFSPCSGASTLRALPGTNNEKGALSPMPFAIDTGTPFGQRARRRLRDERLGWLITTSADGTPQPVPVWFLWDGTASFLLYSTPRTAKLRNIAERPRGA